MKKKKTVKTKRTISKLEKFLYKGFVFVSVILIIGIVFGQATLSKVNLEVEKLKIKSNHQEEANQSLVMIINEKVSLDNIRTIAESQGLVYNNSNIKTIAE